MNKLIYTFKNQWGKILLILVSFIIALFIGAFATLGNSFYLTFVPVILLGIFILLIFNFKNPYVGLIATLCYCFTYFFFSREIGGFQFGLGIELLLIAVWLSIWYNSSKYDFKYLKNNLVYLTLAWFILSVLEIANPAGASPRGWLQEIRGAALYPILLVPLGILFINSKSRLNHFLKAIIFLSLFATFYAIKQTKIGLTSGEKEFLAMGGAVTHIVNGQLRAFSLFGDASQFGPQQALIAVIAFILAMGIKSWWKKLILIIIVVLSFYGMLISGTRGAFFVILGGVIVGILLTKNLRIILVGGTISAIFFAILKFTYIGNSNYNIYRLRSSLDPQDASLNVRLINQQKLSSYLATRPFGGGLGVIGHWGREFNGDKYLSTIAPDSYWVKVWAMYGIVGFIFFFSIWMFIIGYSGGMIWRIEDKNLRLKLSALLGGVVGIFISSYGNEVMNSMPSSIIMSLSIGAIYVLCIKYKEGELTN